MATAQSASRALPPIRASCHAAGVAGRIPVVVDPRCVEHEPKAESGSAYRPRAPRSPSASPVLAQPFRRNRTRAACPHVEHDDEVYDQVHSPEFIGYLTNIHDEWMPVGYP